MKLVQVKMLRTQDQLLEGHTYNLTRDRADTLIQQGDAERGANWESAPTAEVPEARAVVAEQSRSSRETPAKQVLKMPTKPAAKTPTKQTHLKARAR